LETAPDTANDILIISDASEGLDPAELEEAVMIAVIKASSDYLDADVFRSKASIIDITHALANPSQWREVIRALCRAKIAFIDITNFTPGSMMLLGVRSVVRRGVTITLLRARGGDLPWNIREIKSIELDRLELIEESTLNHFGRTVADAWRRFGTEPTYSDLPVYDAIRSLPLGDYSSIPPRQQMLLLCSFSDRYQRNLRFIRTTLHLFEQGDVIRTLDMHSTTLVGRALYDAIRRHDFCLVDWTEWRPSVFFEFGVRLAASRIRPICVIEFEESTATPIQRLAAAPLFSLFTPIQYRIPEMRRLADEIKQQFKVRLDTEFGAISGELPQDETYRIVVDAFEVKDDQYIIPPPHVELQRSAGKLLGDRQRGEHPVLYSDNIHIGRKAVEAGVERLLAAWFYLIGRYTDEELRCSDSLRGELISVGREILYAGRGVVSNKLCDEIRVKLHQFKLLDKEANFQGPDEDKRRA
jgi:hypothetical protein